MRVSLLPLAFMWADVRNPQTPNKYLCKPPPPKAYTKKKKKKKASKPICGVGPMKKPKVLPVKNKSLEMNYRPGKNIGHWFALYLMIWFYHI